MAAGPPVVLFPSLAGSVLECEQSPLEGYPGTRIWMGVGTLLAGQGSKHEVILRDPSGYTWGVKHPFVQHLVLDPSRPGRDVPQFKVREKQGLAGCEYLNETAMVKGGTVIMVNCPSKPDTAC